MIFDFTRVRKLIIYLTRIEYFIINFYLYNCVTYCVINMLFVRSTMKIVMKANHY